MNTNYIVSAPTFDYETGNHKLTCSFSTLEEARAFRDKIIAHINYAGPRNTPHPSLREPMQNEDESDEAFKIRYDAWYERCQQHEEESMDWFDMGHGYFRAPPTITKKTWTEEVIA